MVEPRYLAGLDEAQERAVTYNDGPLLVESGPGSGKTRVLTCRVARLIADGMAPRRLLAITFTNKAAREMQSRLGNLLDPSVASAVSASTFHSACVPILKDEIRLVRPHSDFTINDTADTTRLLRSVIEDLGRDPDEDPPRKAQALISRAKNHNLTVDEVEVNAAALRDDGSRQGEADDMSFCAEVYRGYERRMIAMQRVDFDDLLMLTLRVFVTHPDALTRWRERYDHLLVDEFQDTNMVQNEIAILLADKHRQITAVGDSDQGIYGFRGANIHNILELHRRFKDLHVVELGRNYRSAANIVAAASAVIAHNRHRRSKRLWTERPDGPLVAQHCASDEEREADWVAGQIIEREDTADNSWRDMAVLFRVNAQSRPLEHGLTAACIPYKLLSGPSFYERRETADALAYLRAAVDPDDEDSVRRALRSPPRGVGVKTMAKIEEFARLWKLSLMAALQQHRRMKLWSVAARGVSEFVKTMAAVSAAPEPAVALRRAIDLSGMRSRLQAEGTGEALDRLANLDELIGAAGEHAAATDFLAEVDRIVASADRGQADRDAVSLSTLHSAKGLEFKHVYMVGCEEGLLPHRLSADDPEQVEEERRLAYVGMTRAMDSLALVRASQRCLYEQTVNNLPSRFLAEMPRSLLVVTSQHPIPHSSPRRDRRAPSGSMMSRVSESHV